MKDSGIKARDHQMAKIIFLLTMKMVQQQATVIDDHQLITCWRTI